MYEVVYDRIQILVFSKSLRYSSEDNMMDLHAIDQLREIY